MRGPAPVVRLVAFAALGLLLAGCADDSASTPTGSKLIVYVEDTKDPVEGYAYIGSGSGSCTPVVAVCVYSGTSESYMITPDDGDTLAVHIELQATNMDETIDWRLECQAPPAEEGEEETDTDHLRGVEACRSSLAKGQDKLPFTIEATNLRLPPETAVSIILLAPSIAPGADTAMSLLRGSSDYSGWLLVERVIGTKVVPDDGSETGL